MRTACRGHGSNTTEAPGQTPRRNLTFPHRGLPDRDFAALLRLGRPNQLRDRRIPSGGWPLGNKPEVQASHSTKRLVPSGCQEAAPKVVCSHPVSLSPQGDVNRLVKLARRFDGPQPIFTLDSNFGGTNPEALCNAASPCPARRPHGNEKRRPKAAFSASR
jgi:hypothetical protein